ncbi:MAG: hypothetical protein ACI4TX_05075 [Christensenellales bacterium]
MVSGVISKYNLINTKGDIKFRGFLSARAMRILGYSLIVLTQFFVIIYSLSETISLPKWLIDIAGNYEYIAPLSLPILSFAFFSMIISSRENIKQCILRYFIASILIYLAIILLFDRYLIGFMSVISEDYESARIYAEAFVMGLFGSFINYNIFVDLFLFAIFFYFLICKPKCIKTKYSLFLFRTLSFIPVIVVVLTFILYALHNFEIITLPLEVLPILPCRSICIYLIYFTIVIAMKIRQIRMEKHNITAEQYKSYLYSNRNSLRFSVFSSIVIIVVCLFDFILSLLLPNAELFGIGVSYSMMFVVPIILCFSYTRQPKTQMLDNVFRGIFILVYILMYLETALYVVNA